MAFARTAFAEDTGFSSSAFLFGDQPEGEEREYGGGSGGRAIILPTRPEGQAADMSEEMAVLMIAVGLIDEE